MASASTESRSVFIFIAPADESGGVGDYAQHVLDAVRDIFDEVQEIRTRAPEKDSWGDILRWRRQLRQLEKRYGTRNTIVHAELASGCVGPFWVLKSSRSQRRTAVIHDAPYPVWWPTRNRTVISMMRLHWRIGLWYDRIERRLFTGALRRMERRSLRGVNVAALSDIGARSISAILDGAPVMSGRHYVPEQDPAEIVPVVDRPMAVGLFGHVYGGKGFDVLTQLRVEIPDEIEIRVAGRGTEKLKSMRGVTILGSIDGAGVAEFFNSIRVLVLPYNRIHGRDPVYPASGAAARAFSFHTPVISTKAGTLPEAAEDGGLLAVADVDPVTNDADVEKLGVVVAELLNDPARLAALQQETASLAERRTIRSSLGDLVSLWTRWTDEIHGRAAEGSRL